MTNQDYYLCLTSNGIVKKKRETRVFVLIKRHNFLVTKRIARMNPNDAKLIKEDSDKFFYDWLNKNIDNNNPKHILPYSKINS